MRVVVSDIQGHALQSDRVRRKMSDQIAVPMNTIGNPFICDVSIYQDIINEKGDITRHVDWEKAYKRGIRVAILRATIGNYREDKSCKPNYEACKQLGILTTFYHVETPEYDAKEQSKYFLDHIPGTPDLPLVIDNELVRGCNRQRITSVTQTIAKLLEEADGRPPFMYTSQGFWDENVLPWSGWKRLPLFNAWYPWDLSYPLTMPKRRTPRDWIVDGKPVWDWWQKEADGNAKGREYGVWSGDIDLSFYNGTVEGFETKYKVTVADKGYLSPIDDEYEIVTVDLGNGYGEVVQRPLRSETKRTYFPREYLKAV